MAQYERALSETVGLLLIAFLIILVTLLVIASTTGMLTKFLQKLAFVAVMADEIDTITAQTSSASITNREIR